jgi:RNA polymerase subunit RPABC4/transcription elongation factor Spt4
MVACSFSIIWQQNPNKTEITVSAEDTKNSVSTDHELDVAVGFDNTDSILKWEKVVVYTCSTKECNSFDQLKRVLASLTVTDNLDNLTSIIKPQEPFQGRWCDRASNATFDDCNITVPVTACTQCSLIGQITQTKTEVCATCLTSGTDSNFLTYAVVINMIDRTHATNWEIQCQAERCNSLTNGDLIRQQSEIDFDFLKFFNAGNKLTSLSTMVKMAWIFIIFIVLTKTNFHNF